ncbi:MAG: 2-polyprenylphenol 6-hydroxylase [Bauldia sp.]|nr:2-polyprenylphenol 6-hydroxylase [Bauldia sp.]
MSRIGPYLRLARAGFVLAREGAFGFPEAEAMSARAGPAVRLARLVERRGLGEAERADRLTKALNRLGPSWVKLGQFLATRPDLVGRSFSLALGRLRDEIEPFPEEEARASIAAALGKPAGEIFVSLSPPVAAASIAQVHRAEVVQADGTRRALAVKVLRPGIRQRFRRDLETFYAGAHIAVRRPEMQRLRPVEVVDTLARSVSFEMDLRIEAAALSEMAEATASDPGFRVPSVDWARTARDVLTLDWVDGIRLSDLSALKAAGHDLPALARRLMQSFLRHALRDGFFHADMHQGNLFVDVEGNIVAVDFGITGRLTRAQRRFLAEILYGFIRRDYQRIAEVHFEAGFVPRHHAIEDFAQALRAIGEPIHGLPAREISMARLLTLLFEVTELFDMETRPELLMLQKTMVVVEGVSRSLDPDFDMWASSEPIVREWVERHLGPAGRLEDAAEGVGALGRLMVALPVLADRAEKLSLDLARMSERGIRLDPETVAELRQSDARAAWPTRAALWVIAAALVVLVIQLLR